MSKLLLRAGAIGYLTNRMNGRGAPSGEMQGTAYGFLNKMVADTSNLPEIYWVTNLNDTGAGSLRDALSSGDETVPRVVLFAVNGEIDTAVDTTRTHDGYTHTVYQNIEFNRKNVLVAGQSAPPAASGSVGRGVQVKGRFYSRFPHTNHNAVFWHIRCQPMTGIITSSVKGEESWLINPADYTGARPGGFAWVNCSAHGTMDEAFKLDDHAEGDNVINGWVLQGCYFHGSNHYGYGSVLYGGADPAGVNIASGVGGYGLDCGGYNEGGLMQENILDTNTLRTPQVGGHFKGLLVNNYHWNFGYHGVGDGVSERKGCPVYVAPVQEGDDAVSGQTAKLYIGTASNVGEAGLISDPWRWNGEYIGLRASFDSRDVDFYHNDDDWIFSYYQDGEGGNNLTSQNINLSETIQSEWYPANTSPYASFVASPPYPFPEIILPSSQVRQNALDHAGAWPVARDSVDLELIAEVEAKTSWVIPGIPMPAVDGNTRLIASNLPRITDNGPLYPENSGQSPTYADPDGFPSSPWATEANGLYALENWLWRRHVSAGGVLNYAAADWFNRDWSSLWTP